MKNKSKLKKIAFIFDIDGVVVDSPHEKAWGQALKKFSGKILTSKNYFQTAAGRPRKEGAREIFKRFNLDFGKNEKKLEQFCDLKQSIVEKLINQKKFKIYLSTINLMLEAKKDGILLAAASSSKNAKKMLQTTDLGDYSIKSKKTLYDIFDLDVCGRNIPFGKPDPEIFLIAAKELKVSPKNCLVFEDAVSGIQAACRAKMLAIGICRQGETINNLIKAGAKIVVRDLSELPYQKLKKIVLTRK